MSTAIVSPETDRRKLPRDRLKMVAKSSSSPRREASTITVRLPHASILGVEQNQTEVLAFENGLWNRISAADLENELAVLPELARRKATESGILAEAETALQKQLEERVQGARHFNLVYQNAPVKD